MKVTLKFVLVLIVVLFAIRTFEGLLMVKRETDRLNTAIRRDGLSQRRWPALVVGHFQS